MKTYKQLQEDTVGIVKNIMNPPELENIRNFAYQLSSSFQSTVLETLKRIDQELNKYGYSLGDVQIGEGDLGDDGEAFLVIETFSTHEMLQNVFMIVKWEKMASGQQYQYRREGSALRYSVTLSVFEATPDQLKNIIDSQKDGYVYYEA